MQHIDEIPDDLKKLYKTVWEISQRALIDMAADRGAFIDQSQSFNVHIAEPNFGKLTSMHFYAWKKASEIILLCRRPSGCALHDVGCYYHIPPPPPKQGLKTGMYYLRTRPAANAIQFTIDQKVVMEARQKQRKSQKHKKGEDDKENQEQAIACSLQNREACVMCSS